MHRGIKTLFLLLVYGYIGGAFGQESQVLEDIDCDLLLGDWSGVYDESNGEGYRFDSALDEDGSIIVDFHYFGGGSDRHEGYWDCENNILTTGMITRYGGSILYHYQILRVDRVSMSYRQLDSGISFYSERVGARIMNPEIYDAL